VVFGLKGASSRGRKDRTNAYAYVGKEFILRAINLSSRLRFCAI
jgi:hypothetical protein